MQNNELYHYGVPGMKWGVKRSQQVKRTPVKGKSRKKEIRKTYKEIQKNASVGDKILFSNKNRKERATYMVDYNMSLKEATKKAHISAAKKTAKLLIKVGALSIKTVSVRTTK